MSEINLKKFCISVPPFVPNIDKQTGQTLPGVWITRINGDADGEGGWFDADKFEKVIEKFYNKHF